MMDVNVDEMVRGYVAQFQSVGFVVDSPLSLQLAPDVPVSRGSIERDSLLTDDRDPHCLDTLQQRFEDGHNLTEQEARWVLVECRRLIRAARCADARVVELERQAKDKDRDYTGLVMEWQDLSESHTRVEQQLADVRMLLECRHGELETLREQLSAQGIDNEPTIVET